MISPFSSVSFLFLFTPSLPIMSSNTTSVDQSVLGLSLPAGGYALPDYIIGGVYGAFSTTVIFIAWRAFSRKKPIGSAYINLHFFALVSSDPSTLATAYSLTFCHRHDALVTFFVASPMT